MPASPTEALAAQRGALADQLGHALATGDTPIAELRELQERLRLIDSALAERQADADRRLTHTLAPMALVALVLSAAATLRVPVVPLSLELQTNAATLTLADAAALGPLAMHGQGRVEGLFAVVSPDAALSRAVASERIETLALSADELRLRTLQLPARSRLTVQSGPDATSLRVESPQAPVQAEFELRGRTTLRSGDAVPPQTGLYERGEWLRVEAGDGKTPPPPLDLSFGRDAGDLPRLAGLRPVALRFSERRDGGVGSSVEGGTLHLPATSETLKLSAGDWLEIDGLEVERCEIVAGAPLVVRLNGSARSLRLRVGEFDRSLKPSWLEYVARHHLVQLLWASAAVLWGAWAWTRKQFAGVR